MDNEPDLVIGEKKGKIKKIFLTSPNDIVASQIGLLGM